LKSLQDACIFPLENDTAAAVVKCNIIADLHSNTGKKHFALTKCSRNMEQNSG
jgi:hypothetical protein